MGRKAKELTDEQKAQVEALASCLSQEQIADYFKIGKTTWFAMIERDPEISERYKAGKAKVIRDIANTLIEQAKKGDKAAAMFYLKTQAGWRETTHIDHSNTDGTLNPLKIEIVAPDDNSTD